MLKLLGAFFLGLITASYVFVINGYKTEYIAPQSSQWYQLIKEGKLPEPLEITYSEMKSNGFVIEIIGTINNPRSSQVDLTKISADLFDIDGGFYHKCESWIPIIGPNKKYNFKFHCANIEDIKFEKGSTAKVYIDV